MARVAQRFDGGGHVPAAGCTLPGPVEAAAETIIAALEEELQLQS